ncbi:MAG TPA: hypothetical protein RMH99_14415, partial [Sandaracinaceae bacterium LLY-WYZ-13_1]|nr:hypothetical protein [Sandaracinaceae bacterium LLY-WYZ-13_1]
VRVETALRPTAFTRERPFDLELGYVLEDPFDGLTRHGASLGASTTLMGDRFWRLALRASAEGLWSANDRWRAGATVGARVEIVGWSSGRERAEGNLLMFWAAAGYGEAALGLELWASGRVASDEASAIVGASLTVNVPAAVGAAGVLLPVVALLPEGRAEQLPSGDAGDEDLLDPSSPGTATEARPAPAPRVRVVRCRIGLGEWQRFDDLADPARAQRRCFRQNDVSAVPGGCECEVIHTPGFPNPR